MILRLPHSRGMTIKGMIESSFPLFYSPNHQSTESYTVALDQDHHSGKIAFEIGRVVETLLAVERPYVPVFEERRFAGVPPPEMGPAWITGPPRMIPSKSRRLGFSLKAPL